MRVQKTVSLAANRSDCGFHFQAGDALFLGCLLRISSNPHVPADEEKNSIHNATRPLLLQSHAIRTQNAGATYQRLMTKIFKPLIGRSVEVYIDDIVVKSKLESSISSIYKKFLSLRNQRGIEVSPDQVKAVMETPPPRSKKELQRLTGKLVALGRFIARFTDELRPFFLAYEKLERTGGRTIAKNALERIKHCLMQPPILSSLIPKEKLYMYLAVSEWAISVVLFAAHHPRSRSPSTMSVGHWQT
ncbi:hypothetical protein CK203_050376 [Vitis vinifera]|uniref:Reverse transcriptase domain-containing protein n=1 Tax=Vitis vinifera TaxID=29760 RepID=A0A438GM36_VITVI|nr:hypothetical protein CK203_050376 [Vitis vinifera]